VAERRARHEPEGNQRQRRDRPGQAGENGATPVAKPEAPGEPFTGGRRPRIDRRQRVRARVEAPAVAAGRQVLPQRALVGDGDPAGEVGVDRAPEAGASIARAGDRGGKGHGSSSFMKARRVCRIRSSR
jgi:hypothetical protein